MKSDFNYVANLFYNDLTVKQIFQGRLSDHDKVSQNPYFIANN